MLFYQLCPTLAVNFYVDHWHFLLLLTEFSTYRIKLDFKLKHTIKRGGRGVILPTYNELLFTYSAINCFIL